MIPVPVRTWVGVAVAAWIETEIVDTVIYPVAILPLVMPDHMVTVFWDAELVAEMSL